MGRNLRARARILGGLLLTALLLLGGCFIPEQRPVLRPPAAPPKAPAPTDTPAALLSPAKGATMVASCGPGDEAPPAAFVYVHNNQMGAFQRQRPATLAETLGAWPDGARLRAECTRRVATDPVDTWWRLSDEQGNAGWVPSKWLSLAPPPSPSPTALPPSPTSVVQPLLPTPTASPTVVTGTPTTTPTSTSTPTVTPTPTMTATPTGTATSTPSAVGCLGDERIVFTPPRPAVGQEVKIIVTSARGHMNVALAGLGSPTFLGPWRTSWGYQWEWRAQVTENRRHVYNFFADYTRLCTANFFDIEPAPVTPTPVPGLAGCLGDERIVFTPPQPRVGQTVKMIVTSARAHQNVRLEGPANPTFLGAWGTSTGFQWEWSATITQQMRHVYNFFVEGTRLCTSNFFDVSS